MIYIFTIFALIFQVNAQNTIDIEKLQINADQGDDNSQTQLGLCYAKGEFVVKDYLEAAKWYRKAAEQGNASAQHLLGLCYMNGKGVAKDSTEAVKWYLKAAEQGNASAQHSLGLFYMRVAKDLTEAVKWYLKAAEQGNASAQFSLGVCYANGDGVSQDQEEAVKWYRKAAEQGNTSAQVNLGVCYANGDGVSEDQVEAVKWYRKAAEQGNASAQNYLAGCYADGDGVSQDQEEAVKWYRKAAEQGDRHAQFRLGLYYMNGEGVAKDSTEAVKWYLKAAEQGNASAQHLLGLCYMNGKGVGKDLTEAVKWYLKAAEQGNASAQFSLGVCYANGDGVSQDQEEAVKWYRKAAEQGFAQAQTKLGYCYAKGKGISKDEAEAVKWYRKAADQGLASAQYILGHFYANGIGIKRDLNHAVMWYEKAIKGGNENAMASLAWVLSETRKNDDKFKPDYRRAILLFEQVKNKDGADYDRIGWIYGKTSLKNFDKMIEAFEKAVYMGDSNAMSNMAICYRRGDGVVKNYTESLSYEYLAQANGKPNKEAISFLENYLAPASIQAAQKKAQLLHAQIKENKNKSQSDTVSEAPEGDTPSRPSGSGSGILISKTGVVATAFHVVEGAKKIKIKTLNATYMGKILASDKSNDLAILQIVGGDQSFSAVPIASSGAVKLGQSVFTLGFPNIEVQGFNLKMTKGEISSTSGIQDDPRQFQISVPVQAGNSGGPLFDENGNVVGIVVAKLNAAFMAKHTGDLPQNVNYAVKSAYLKPLVEEFSEQLPNSNRSTEEEKTEDLVSKVKDACVMILVE
jgi:TPR repeat protein